MNALHNQLRAALVALPIAALIAAAAPSYAQGDTRPCLRWTTQGTGKMDIRQSNGIIVRMHLLTNGNRVNGDAEYTVPGRPVDGPFGWFGAVKSFGYVNDGDVAGTLWNDYIEFRVNWADGHQGYYSGSINRMGHVYGTTYRVGAPGSQTVWTTMVPFVCAQREVPPPQPVTPPSNPVLKPSNGSIAAKSIGLLLGGSGLSGGAATTRPQSAPLAPPPPPLPGAGVTPVAQTNPATCRSGFVWRVARPTDLVCVTPASRERVAQENAVARSRVQPGGGAYGPNTCRAGFVWREAFAGDLVCVTPDVRAQVAEENRLAASRRALVLPRD